jgi:CheY-like chemotaxis protein
LGEVLEEVRQTLAPMAARQGLGLELAPAPADVPAVFVDRVRFTQILLNFGTNAIKYNRPSGSVRFEVTLREDDRVRVTVVDTGMGIAVQEQPKLFQAFHRAGQEAGSIDGSGIGLNVSKRLAELMGGSVGFQSVVSQGSEFWVDVPTRRVGAPSSRSPSFRDSGDGQSTLRGSVLYVEDNPANVRFMRDLMSDFDDIVLLTAGTGEEGVALAVEERPDLIIMDINLPGMSGVEALAALRAKPETSKIPVIALTAAATKQDRERGGAAGFDRYLTKPVRIPELESALADVLGQRARAK